MSVRPATTTADFAGDLDEATVEARIELAGSVLERVAGATDLDIFDAPRAVAAAALAAAQCPGGEPIDSSSRSAHADAAAPRPAAGPVPHSSACRSAATPGLPALRASRRAFGVTAAERQRQRPARAQAAARAARLGPP
ncbi:DUF4259 domain-containing protein [Micromonospora sp. ZYX-F-536]|uniref:DUF4259 domain-containing protein n=1 Tax=Micromonospora sp. ZYX-F-536 TaxID=3457629 RepID=UPI004040920C